MEDKVRDRMDRKRLREKKRRTDTNSQFAALADLVREIEVTDLVEEAQANARAERRRAGDNGHLHGDPLPAAAFPAFNPSNRVDLISRTIAQLTQFRIIRRRRTAEVREVERQNCELQKECEDLRRTVAHYKAVGMAGPNPQEKVMMMVPMMVPQDSVGQIANGYPAAHQIAAGPAGAPQTQFTALAPWMAGGAMAGAAHTTPVVAGMGLPSSTAAPVALPGLAMPPPVPGDLHAAPGAPTPAPMQGTGGCPAPGVLHQAENPPAGPGGGGNLAHCA